MLRLQPYIAALLLTTSSLTLAGSPAITPQITGEPGSPGATTTISGKQLPAPDPKFGGVITQDALKSKPWWAPRIVPPRGGTQRAAHHYG